jgi:hypothetical protein
VRPRGLPKPRQFPSSQGLGHAELTPCHRLPATELTPCPRLGCLCLVPRSCLPQTPPQHPTSFLRTATTKSKRRIYPQRIVKSSTNSQRTHYESSIRLEEISGTLFRSCWTPWPTNRSTQAPPRSLFPTAAEEPTSVPPPHYSKASHAEPLLGGESLTSSPLWELTPEPERRQRAPPPPLKIA